ncbi:MAG: mannose-1-phosphate guanylyltransferase [Bacteroidales bacterium]|nr:mannose-1-phosphate guanylyltransferase [Bacteroidales bacterium]
MMDRYCVIMAGGIGSRFWPLSKDNMPKQFLDILGTGKSFIRATFERFLPLVPAEHFIVVTNAAYKQLVLEHLPELKEDQVLCEPMRRNTAPCIAYATYHILSQCPEASIAVTPADHLVTNGIEFTRVIGQGLDFVEQHRDALMTIGIKPSRPETGYGYIEVSSIEDCIVPVKNFKEKPDLETAKRFVADGRYFWNSGIFLWSTDAIMAAYRSYLPDMVTLFDEGKADFGTPREQQFINRQFERCENISIDYGVMERSDSRYTVCADFGWSDIGTWGSLYTHAAHDQADNAISGHALPVDTTASVINIEPGYKAIVQGLDHCLVALRDKSLLVCRLEDEQQIKHWVEKL